MMRRYAQAVLLCWTWVGLGYKGAVFGVDLNDKAHGIIFRALASFLLGDYHLFTSCCHGSEITVVLNAVTDPQLGKAVQNTIYGGCPFDVTLVAALGWIVLSAAGNDVRAFVIALREVGVAVGVHGVLLFVDGTNVGQ
jgi:hypothetical protein